MIRWCAIVAVCGLAVPALASDPWADHVEQYTPGVGAAPGYGNPLVALGEPSRFTQDGQWSSAVSPYNAPYQPDQIVSIGAGGSLTVRFDEPIVNDPSHPFGIDLLIFGNSFYTDTGYPGGAAGPLGGNGGGTVEVSQDGMNWFLAPGAHADGAFPTLGYAGLLDPYSPVPGATPTDFTLPLDPTLNPVGLCYAALIAAYGQSGGGSGVDIGAAGLSSVSYVRISNPLGATNSVEIDAVSAVPAPGGFAMLAVAGLGRRRRTR